MLIKDRKTAITMDWEKCIVGIQLGYWGHFTAFRTELVKVQSIQKQPGWKYLFLFMDDAMEFYWFILEPQPFYLDSLSTEKKNKTVVWEPPS